MKREIALILALSFLLQIAAGIVELDNIPGQDASIAKEKVGTEVSQRLLSENGGGLVARWGFDEGSGSATGDGTGNGNDGTLENMGSDSWVDGRRKTGLEFDGGNDYVDCGNGSILDIVDKITIEIWLKPYSTLKKGTSDAASVGIIGNTGPSGEGYVLGHLWSDPTNTLRFRIGGSSVTSSPIKVGEWTNIVATYGNDEASIYINGELVNSTSSNAPETSDQPLVIGRWAHHHNGYYFNGIIDEVSVYDRALSADEIADHYQSIHVEQDEFGGSWFDDFDDESGVEWKDNIELLNGNVMFFTVGREQWNRTYGGSDYELGNSLAQTADGGYVITGFTESYGQRVGWLVKTDAKGNEQWNNTYEGSYEGKSVIEDSNGDYVVVGQKDVGGGNLDDVWLMKTDKNGNKLWEKTHGDTHNDVGNSIQQTKDGGYIIAGYGGNNDMLLLKTDISGTKQWDKTFGGDELDMGESVITTSDGGYIIVGSIPYGGTGHNNVSVIKTDSTGNIQWEKRFGGKETCDRGYSAIECRNGGYIVTGDTGKYGGSDLWLISIDNSGKELWNKTFNGGTSGAHSILESSEGGYLIAGSTDSYGSGSTDAWLLKTDSLGNELWNETIGGNDKDIAHCLIKSSDGGYALVGQTISYGTGNFDAWLIKCRDQFYNRGSTKSIPIELINDMYWSSLSVSKTEPANTCINISVIDMATNQTIPGFKNLTNRIIDLSTLNDLGITSIRLKAHFSGNGSATPILDSWGVEWTAENAWRDSFVGDSKIAYPYGVDEHTVGYWQFDEGRGNVARDLSGNGNDGMILGAQWCEGRFGDGLEFDGEDNYVEIPDSNSLDFVNKISIETMVSFYEYSGRLQGIVGKNHFLTLNDEYGISYDDRSGRKNLFFTISDGNFRKDAIIKWSPNIGQWYHIAGTYDGEKVRLYIDGSIVSEEDHKITKINDRGTNFFIGRCAYDALYFHGKIDEVRISNISRTPEEIYHNAMLGLAIRNGQAQLADNEIIPDQSTGALWHFNEGEGNTLRDSSGNDNAGEIYGANWTEGVLGKALEFDGEDDYIDINSSSLKNVFNPGSKFSIGFLFNPREVPSQWQWLFSKAYYSHIPPYYQIDIRYSSDKKVVARVQSDVGGPYLIVTSAITFKINSWHHIVMTVDLSENVLRLYANGHLMSNDTTPTGSYANWDTSITIGRNKNAKSSTYFFNGIIDEVAIFNRALSPSEIYKHSRLYRPNASLRSVAITLPDGHAWSDLHFSRSVTDNTYLNITAHDATTGEILTTDSGNENQRTVDLSSINARKHPSIYLEAFFESNRTKTPFLYDWAVSWVEILPPELTSPIGTITLLEDTPQAGILDLSEHFYDEYADMGSPVYGLEYVSDRINVTLQINGSLMDVANISNNWTGSLHVIINCTNFMGRTTSSNEFSVVVSEVDDAPAWIRRPPAIKVTEDIFLITPWSLRDFISDAENDEIGSVITDSSPEVNVTITDDHHLYVIPSDNYTGYGNATVRVFELNDTAKYNDINITINVTPVNDAPVVTLVGPSNGAIVNEVNVTFTWQARDAENDPLSFDVYLGKSDPPVLHTSGITSCNITVNGLDDGTVYYWYVIPSDGELTGKCLNRTYGFTVNVSSSGTGIIVVEFDVNGLIIEQGSDTGFNMSLRNTDEYGKNVGIIPTGRLSDNVISNASVVLNAGERKIISVRIWNTTAIPPGNYKLSFLITYDGGWERVSLPVTVLSADAPADDDDGPIGTPENKKVNWWIIILASACAVIVLAAILLLVIVGRKKRKNGTEEIFEIPAEEPHPPKKQEDLYGEGFGAWQQAQTPAPRPPAAMPEQYDHYEGPATAQETSPDIHSGQSVPESGTPYDYTPTPRSEPGPPIAPPGDTEGSLLFTTIDAVQCSICLGYIKNGAQAYRCTCGKIYHPTCGVRTGRCPVCQRTITRGEVGLDNVEFPRDESAVDPRPEEIPVSVSWHGEPVILDAGDDFNLSDVFLISLDGLLIRSLSFGTSVRDGTDEDIMTGMLTAVTDFIRDSFRDEMGGLKTLQYGRMTIYLERGVTFYLVAVFRGEPPDDLRRRMRDALIQVWERYKHYLKAWDGTPDGLEEIDNCLMGSLGLQPPPADEPPGAPQGGGDEYQPPKFTGDISTSVPGEGEMPNVVTAADISTRQGCYHLYNMLLAKKGADIRIGPGSPRVDISKARKQIIMMYHPDRWQGDQDKATFFMQKVNVAWEVLSAIPGD